MSENNPIPVTVRILDREYQVACREDEKQLLLDSARYLDSKMKDIKGDRKVVGTDRIAVMAALNIAHEYLQCQNGLRSAKVETAAVKTVATTASSSEMDNNTAISRERLHSLQEKLDLALNRYKQTELAI